MRSSEGANVSARCHSQAVIDLITQTLDEENLHKFRNGPFGHLLRLQHVTQNFQCQLFYYCMKLLNQSKRRKGVLVFNFNNSEVHFGRRDWFLMSGLKFGPIEKAPLTSTLHKNYFGETKSLKMHMIKQNLADAKKYSEGGRGGGEHCLKLANALFVYGVLLPRDNDRMKLDIRYLHLADDVERFNEYPWGLVSYNYFVKEFIASCDRMNNLARSHGKPNYEIFGFLYVFQYWIYEIFPLLGENCGDRIDGWENIFPRVLRWKAARGQWTFKKLQGLFSDSACTTVHPLFLSDEEQIQVSPIEQFLEEDIDAMEEDYPVVKNTTRKRKLHFDIELETGESSKKPHADKKIYSLRSMKGSRGDEPLKTPIQNAEEARDEEDSDESVESISTPNANARDRKINSRLGKLEVLYSSLNEKMSIVVGFIEFLRSKDAMRKDSTTPTTTPAKTATTPGPGGLDFQEDNLFNIPIVGLSSSNTAHIQDVFNVDDDECIGDDLDEECVDENGQIRLLHALEGDVGEGDVGEGDFCKQSGEGDMGEGDDCKQCGEGDVGEDFVGDVMKENVPVQSVPVDKYGDPLDSDIDVDFENLHCLVNRVTVDILHDGKFLEPVVKEPVKKSVGGEGCLVQKKLGFEGVPVQEKHGAEAEDDGGEGAHKTAAGAFNIPKVRPNTRSNPVVVTSSSDCSSSFDAFLRLPPKAVQSRFAAPKAEMFDPLKRYAPAFIKPFNTWYSNPPAHERCVIFFCSKHTIEVNNNLYHSLPSQLFRLRVPCPVKGGVWFFEGLTRKIGWLSTLNCDAILNLLLFKAHLKPNIFLERWTILESYGWSYFKASDITPNKDALLKYLNGESIEHGKSWRDVDQVLGIAWIDGNHFAAYQIRIPEQQIVVFDSRCNSENRWNDVKDQFYLMSIRLSWLCREAGVTHFIGPEKDTWDVIQNPDTPQQPNRHDCGIYSLKFIECLVSGRPVSYLAGDLFASRSRDYYCAELFNSRVKAGNSVNA